MPKIRAHHNRINEIFIGSPTILWNAFSLHLFGNKLDRHHTLSCGSHLPIFTSFLNEHIFLLSVLKIWELVRKKNILTGFRLFLRTDCTSKGFKPEIDEHHDSVSNINICIWLKRYWMLKWTGPTIRMSYSVFGQMISFAFMSKIRWHLIW